MGLWGRHSSLTCLILRDSIGAVSAREMMWKPREVKWLPKVTQLGDGRARTEAGSFRVNAGPSPQTSLPSISLKKTVKLCHLRLVRSKNK